MNCPNCGADTRNAVTICPLCGTTLDRDSAYNSYLKKGDDFFSSGETDKGIMSYNKALEYSAGNEEIYLKLGNAYNKNNDKKAATAYMKALTFNFYNDKTHNMLIALYSKYGRLADLKKWYEQSRGKADAAFVDKYIKIIDNVDYFSRSSDVKIPSSKNEGLARTLVSSMKKYVIMNIVVGIFVLVIALAVVAAFVFKVDTSFIVLFSGFFMAVAIVVIFITRQGAARKKSVSKLDLAALMAEEVAKAKLGSSAPGKAEENDEVKSPDSGRDEPPAL